MQKQGEMGREYIIDILEHWDASIVWNWEWEQGMGRKTKSYYQLGVSMPSISYWKDSPMWLASYSSLSFLSCTFTLISLSRLCISLIFPSLLFSSLLSTIIPFSSPNLSLNSWFPAFNCLFLSSVSICSSCLFFTITSTFLASCNNDQNSSECLLVSNSEYISSTDDSSDPTSSFIIILSNNTHPPQLINLSQTSIIIESTMEGVISKQLYDRMLEIQHEEMPQIVAIIKDLLKNNSFNPKFYHRLWKALFFALWNYDKMYNQHLFCEQISLIIHTLPTHKAEHFLTEGLTLIDNYWNKIDHHRINKFMKLVRYLLREAHVYWRNNNLSVTGLEYVLKGKIFYELEDNNGLRFHVLDIYYDILEEAGIDVKKEIGYLDILRQLLFESKDKRFRQYIIEKVYERIKGLLDIDGILGLAGEITEKANEVEDESLRRSLFTLIGFLKSQYGLYIAYRQRKLQNQQKQRQKTKKKISKGKRKQILEKREKKTAIKKLKKKKADIISKSKLEMSVNL